MDNVLDTVLKEKEFKEGEYQDTCPICLDDFQAGKNICELPCQHSFHRACVEQWLSEHSTICPLCKRDVFGEAQAIQNNNFEEPTALWEPTPLTAEDMFLLSLFSRDDTAGEQFTL